ncbi:Ger(x)C family spore germination protein [Litchfieldia alkalitelluris]|uniref:Ger(x)C family spore germination protein n=1 Tax=Litchfieldia alkalitelluris TaxID=304268 RepID=UPI0009971034|nr:Ger(x)C family spore germination protein [Litchfieldia alkalitelluris]
MHRVKLLFVFLILVITTGCWDSIEIEQRGFVIGAGIDLEDNDKKNKGDLKLTQQFVVPSAIAEGSSGGTGKGQAYQNIESKGNTIFETVRRVAAITSRSPFFEHIKLIVLSEDVAKSEYFPDVLDYFLRFPEMRRGTQIMITPEKAKDILEVSPENENLPTMYIQSISKNNFKNARMVPPTRIGDVHEFLLGKESFIIQMITKLSDNEVKIAGHAVINGQTDKLVGFIGEEATEGVNFITGEIEGGLLEAKVDDEIVVYEMDIVNSKIKPTVLGDRQFKFTVEIETVGSIPETFKPVNLLSEEEIRQTEEGVEDSIRYFTDLAIERVQKELKTDVFRFGKYLSIKDPDEWGKVEDNWDFGENYFEKAEIEVKVDATISRNGAIIKSTLE